MQVFQGLSKLLTHPEDFLADEYILLHRSPPSVYIFGGVEGYGYSGRADDDSPKIKTYAV